MMVMLLVMMRRCLGYRRGAGRRQVAGSNSLQRGPAAGEVDAADDAADEQQQSQEYPKEGSHREPPVGDGG